MEFSKELDLCIEAYDHLSQGLRFFRQCVFTHEPDLCRPCLRKTVIALADACPSMPVFNFHRFLKQHRNCGDASSSASHFSSDVSGSGEVGGGNNEADDGSDTEVNGRKRKRKRTARTIKSEVGRDAGKGDADAAAANGTSAEDSVFRRPPSPRPRSSATVATSVSNSLFSPCHSEGENRSRGGAGGAGGSGEGEEDSGELFLKSCSSSDSTSATHQGSAAEEKSLSYWPPKAREQIDDSDASVSAVEDVDDTAGRFPSRYYRRNRRRSRNRMLRRSRCRNFCA